MNHVMITGGLGFIGHNLARLYLEEGWRVTIVDNLATHSSHPALTKYRIEHIDHKNVEFLQSNCNLTYSVSDKIKTKPDLIVHLASFPNQRAVEKDTFGAVATMNSCLFSVALWAANHNIRMIYASSSMVYGNFEKLAVNETDPTNPINMYGLLKLQGEQLLKMIHANHVIVRPSAVYGPGDNIDRVLAKWVLTAIRDKTLVVNDPGSLLDFTHVSDLVNGIFLAGQRGIVGQTYNITYGQGRSLGEAAMLTMYMAQSDSKLEYDLADDKMPKRGTLDITLAKNDLGYRPKIGLTEGLASYINWMKAHARIFD